VNGETALQKSESFAVGALLALAGGFLDAYTYLCRGGVFANAQTGNMVLLAVRLAEGRWAGALRSLVPILAFFFGVLAAERIRAAGAGGRRLHWRHTGLAVEIAALLAAAAAAPGRWDPAVNSLVSFVCALQAQTFRKVRGNPFASTMCTGNLRSGTEALYHGAVNGDAVLLGRSLCYYGVIACFIAGAALGTALSAVSPRLAPLAPAALLLGAFAVMLEWEHPAA
jgi:uncharacterized membrane protein YoaK (UPF0700 family)